MGQIPPSLLLIVIANSQEALWPKHCSRCFTYIHLFSLSFRVGGDMAESWSALGGEMNLLRVDLCQCVSSL